MTAATCSDRYRVQRSRITILFRSRSEQHDRHAKQAETRAQEVPSIRFPPVEDHTPAQGDNEKNAAIGRVDPSECRIRLKRMDHSVCEQDTGAEQADRPRAINAQPLPDKPAAGDLRQSSDSEQNQRARDLRNQNGLRLRMSDQENAVCSRLIDSSSNSSEFAKLNRMWFADASPKAIPGVTPTRASLMAISAISLPFLPVPDTSG